MSTPTDAYDQTATIWQALHAAEQALEHQVILENRREGLAATRLRMGVMANHPSFQKDKMDQKLMQFEAALESHALATDALVKEALSLVVAAKGALQQ